MATGTIDGQVLAGKRETREVMVEGRRAPPVLVMALRAVLRKTGVDVIGIGNRVIVILVTTYAFLRQIELIIHMAIHAAESGMNTDQFEPAGLDVIEYRPGPGYLGMAGFTVGGKRQGNMRRFIRRIKIIFMATET